MEWWQILLLAVVSSIVVLLATSLVVWRMLTERTRRLASRVGKLPWRSKLQLASRLMRDERIPVLLRLVPPAVVLYLALPLDLVPDFIPVVGQLDDILVVAVGIALLVRLAPMRVLEGHLLDLEAIAAEARDVTEAPPALPDPDRPA